MTLEEAKHRLKAFLTEEFGKILELKDISLSRHVSGLAWQGRAVCLFEDHELNVGPVEIDESGNITRRVYLTDLLNALKRDNSETPDADRSAKPLKPLPQEAPDNRRHDDFSMEFGDISLEDDTLTELSKELSQELSQELYDGDEIDPETIWEKVEALLSSGDPESLVNARELLPRLLENPESRGAILSQMAWVENELGEKALSLDYLQAAAREFADMANLESLNLLCEKAKDIIGEEAYEKSIFNRLLRDTLARMEPIDSLRQVPVLYGLEESLTDKVKDLAVLSEIPGETPLLEEGEPSINVFFVKSGRLTVQLRTPEGFSKPIATLLPGDLIGESSVLSKEAAYCNATVQAEVDSELWRIDGEALKELFKAESLLKERITQARELRRIHSFLSLHPAVGELEALTRERLMGCIEGIVRKRSGQVLIAAGKLPTSAFIVVTGTVEQRISGKTIRLFSADDFIGFRDTLHGISSECEFVIIEDSRLIVFDAERLRELGLDSPPNVVAVLERLG